MKKSYFAVALTILASCFFVVSAEAQSKPKDTSKDKTSSKIKVAKEGVGIEGIRVGRSTAADVIKKFGKSYQTKKYGKYSTAIVYPKLGLAFYSCQADTKKEIFDIEMRAPFQVKTAKGIVLGKSTLEDIYRIYGKNKDGLEYKGVSFFYANYKGKKTVTVIDIVENSGIRQCKEVK
ncbi:MAG: hypothetical protein LUM44_10455 [Pyrinomonadaceae bacterium]|nr:hypothetical protein [Pyrinomonadaceae bacterium]